MVSIVAYYVIYILAIGAKLPHILYKLHVAMQFMP